MADDAQNQGGQNWLAINVHFSLEVEIRNKIAFSDFFLSDLYYYSTNVSDLFVDDIF